ncbi:MAG: DUF3800 domain-containing protein [Terriglobia bacterium]
MGEHVTGGGLWRARSLIGKCAGCVNIGEGDLLIALRAYLDSSRKPEYEHGYLTLAAVAGNDEMWAEFETGWKKILDEHKPKADYVHMREIVRLIEGFDPKRGWDLKSAFDVATQCVGYMSHLDKKRFRMFYCSVDLAAWRKLRAETYQIPEPVDMCNQFCSETVLGWYLHYYPGLIDPHNDTVKYFFDRHECFENPFKEKWNAEKNLAEETGAWSIWKMIDEVASVEMKTTPGIQAADIIAWGMNRETFAEEGDTAKYLEQIIRQVIPAFHIVWDEAKMREYFKPLLYLP